MQTQTTELNVLESIDRHQKALACAYRHVERLHQCQRETADAQEMEDGEISEVSSALCLLAPDTARPDACDAFGVRGEGGQMPTNRRDNGEHAVRQLAGLDPLSPDRLAVAKCLQLAFERGCKVRAEQAHHEVNPRVGGDPIIGHMLATAWRLGLETIVAELLALRASWNKRENGAGE